MRMYACIAAVVCSLLVSGIGHGAVTPIAPFTGEFHDNFDQYTTVLAELNLPVFGGRADIHMLSDGGAIKVETNSNFIGDQVLAVSGWMVGQLGIVDWTFDQPAFRFGGYWENNSGASDSTLQFYDANDALLATLVANVPVNAQHWTWNGWESDIPFSRIRSTGNGIVNGFIWYENMEVSFAPEPTTAAASLAGLMATWMQRRRSRRVYVAVVSCASALSAAALAADDVSSTDCDASGRDSTVVST
ncbi:MAG: hypothetical protein H7Z14_21805, partial [Anaerolineae bacterium]|nr:hypothetical protein [Phycisphaerae bacterium]